MTVGVQPADRPDAGVPVLELDRVSKVYPGRRRYGRWTR